MTVLDVLALAICFVVYLVGSWTIINWAFERFIRPHYRLWFARKYGVPVPILMAWEDEWRRERGFTD